MLKLKCMYKITEHSFTIAGCQRSQLPTTGKLDVNLVYNQTHRRESGELLCTGMMAHLSSIIAMPIDMHTGNGSVVIFFSSIIHVQCTELKLRSVYPSHGGCHAYSEFLVQLLQQLGDHHLPISYIF